MASVPRPDALRSEPSDAAVLYSTVQHAEYVEDASSTNSAGIHSLRIAVEAVPVSRTERLVPPQRSVSLAQLTAICYFAVCGGPFGLEEAVSAGGYWATLAAFVVVPLFWSVPTALLTAELSTLINENGGHVRWVNEGLGRHVGFVNCLVAIVTNVTDNALYPSLFVSYLDAALGSSRSLGAALRWAVKCAVMVAALLLNARGAAAVGAVAGALATVVVTPFAVLTLLGWLSPAASAPQPPSRPDPGTFLTVMMWNFSGFCSAGTCAAEVDDPARTIPRALGISLVLVVLTYVLPLTSAVRAVPAADAWQNGTWVTAADLLGGSALASVLGVFALASAFGLLCTFLCTTTRQLEACVHMGFLPHCLMSLPGRRHAAVPKVAPDQGTAANPPLQLLVFNAVISLACTAVDFAELAQITTIFYSLSTIARFMSMARLRRTRPDGTPGMQPRAFKIPGGMLGLITTCIPPCLLCAFAISQCSVSALIASSSALGAMLVALFVSRSVRARLMPRGFMSADFDAVGVVATSDHVNAMEAEEGEPEIQAIFDTVDGSRQAAGDFDDRKVAVSQ